MKLAEQICYAREQDSPYIGTAEDICPEERPVSEDGLRVSEEEYWEKYYNHPDFAYEWNNGILEEKPMANYLSSETYRWFASVLEEYLKANPVAKPVFLDIGFRLALPGKTSIRKPDVSLILNSNPVGIHGGDSTYRGIFDLCIEFLSDSKQSEIDRDTIV
ncbi:MAG: Uma2 family endonuclease, partial [Desulfobacteraceae bacterium]|nr:Uma2 family endonuclease [Desulfobacteraceae bacterium]